MSGILRPVLWDLLQPPNHYVECWSGFTSVGTGPPTKKDQKKINNKIKLLDKKYHQSTFRKDVLSFPIQSDFPVFRSVWYGPLYIVKGKKTWVIITEWMEYRIEVNCMDELQNEQIQFIFFLCDYLKYLLWISFKVHIYC